MIPNDEVLARFDAEMRRDPVPDRGSTVERLGPIVRVVGEENYVIYSALTDADAREIVAEQADHFRRTAREVEWKWFGHDRPAHLEAILADAGFVPEEPETLLVFDLRDGVPRDPGASEAEIHRVTGAAGIRDVLAANEAAFGPDHRGSTARAEERLADPSQALFVAYAEGVPVASGRLEMTPGRSFAGLYGGGTAPSHRRRGIYRGLVHARAALAKSAGYRFLTVDAQESSRPILERLGFVRLTSTRAWILRAGAGASAEAASPGEGMGPRDLSSAPFPRAESPP
ncbi:MAG: GNAT family N-acetyltransferase [Thermoplasmata archaeon]